MDETKVITTVIVPHVRNPYGPDRPNPLRDAEHLFTSQQLGWIALYANAPSDQTEKAHFLINLNLQLGPHGFAKEELLWGLYVERALSAEGAREAERLEVAEWMGIPVSERGAPKLGTANPHAGWPNATACAIEWINIDPNKTFEAAKKAISKECGKRLMFSKWNRSCFVEPHSWGRFKKHIESDIAANRDAKTRKGRGNSQF